MEDKRVRGVLYLLGVLAFAIILGGGAMDDTSPGQIMLFLIFIVLPIGFVVLVVRALIRVGDKRPPPVQFVAPPTGLGPGWYPDQQRPGFIRWYDGAQWTSHVQPTTTPPPPPSQ